LYTLEEVAQILRISLSTVRRLVGMGELKTVRVGRQIRVRQEDLDDYVRKARS